MKEMTLRMVVGQEEKDTQNSGPVDDDAGSEGEHI